jgi:SAM-dependent methyltransferase
VYRLGVTFTDKLADALMKKEAQFTRRQRLLPVVRLVWLAWGACFDLRYGVKTTHRSVDDLDLETRSYEGFNGRWCLTRVLSPSSIDPSDVFLDAGSGLGRAVLFAAGHYPFRRVVGVELSADYHRVATENVVRYRGHLAPIELINEDILEWKFPDDVTVLFMYNPFSGSIFERFIANVRKSLDECPRKFQIIYVNPAMHPMVLDAGFKEIRHEGRVRVYR